MFVCMDMCSVRFCLEGWKCGSVWWFVICVCFVHVWWLRCGLFVEDTHAFAGTRLSSLYVSMLQLGGVGLSAVSRIGGQRRGGFMIYSARA